MPQMQGQSSLVQLQNPRYDAATTILSVVPRVYGNALLLKERFPMPYAAKHTHDPLLACEVPTAPVLLWPACGALTPADRFIVARLPLAARLAWRYARFSPTLRDDLVQEACLALVEVVRRLPSTMDAAHAEALAVLWMRRRLALALARHASGGPSLPPHALRDWLHLRRVWRQQRHKLGRDPTPAELAVASGMSPARIAALAAPDAVPLALDLLPEGALLANDAPTDPRYAAQRVRAALAQLPLRERQVVAGQFGIGQRRQSVRILARIFAMSPRTVIALRRSGLAHLRAILNAD
jgi:RNA polymerase nonessential primary-like sigma factor